MFEIVLNGKKSAKNIREIFQLRFAPGLLICGSDNNRISYGEFRASEQVKAKFDALEEEERSRRLARRTSESETAAGSSKQSDYTCEFDITLLPPFEIPTASSSTVDKDLSVGSFEELSHTLDKQQLEEQRTKKALKERRAITFDQQRALSLSNTGAHSSSSVSQLVNDQSGEDNISWSIRNRHRPTSVQLRC